MNFPRFLAVTVTGTSLLLSSVSPALVSSVYAKEPVADINSPATPINLTGALSVDGTQVVLNWQWFTAGEFGTSPDKFIIYRVEGDTPNFQNISSLSQVDKTQWTFTDTALQPGKKYNYKVAAYRSTRFVDLGVESLQIFESLNSNMVTVTTPAATPAPAAPSTTTTASNTAPATIPAPVLVGSLSSDQKVGTLNWTSVPNAVGYKLFRSHSAVGGGFQLYRDIGAPTTQFVDSGLVINTSYSYKVRAYLNSGESDDSNTVNLNPYDPSVSGQQPASSTTSSSTATGQVGLVAITLSAEPKSTRQIDLKWDQVPGAVSYKLYRGTTKDNLVLIGYMTGEKTNGGFVIGSDTKDITSNTTYHYQVVAINADNTTGVTSNITPATTPSTDSLPPQVTTPAPIVDTSNPGMPASPDLTAYPDPSGTTPLNNLVVPADACGANDTMSPARITNPASDIKFVSLPKTAVFRTNTSFPFTYCFKNPNTRLYKVVRSFYDAQGNLAATQVVSTRKQTFDKNISISASQQLPRSLSSGLYTVRVQVVNLVSGTSMKYAGDEPIAADQLVGDNGFVISVVNGTTILPTAVDPAMLLPPAINPTNTPATNNPNNPSTPTNPTNPTSPSNSTVGSTGLSAASLLGSLMVPQNDASSVRFPLFSKRNTYRVGETLRFPLTFKNTTGLLKHVTVEYSLVNLSGAKVSTQSRMATVGAGRSLSWNVAQPLFVGLSSGIYTFRVVITDKDTGQQIDTNSFNFALVQ